MGIILVWPVGYVGIEIYNEKDESPGIMYDTYKKKWYVSWCDKYLRTHWGELYIQ